MVVIGNCTVIFNIHYTPYKPKKGLPKWSVVKHAKERLRHNKGNIWHGFISFDEENSHKIDHPDKCIELIKRNFGQFFKDAQMDEENIDLMCSLHLDTEHHLHIHFCFWEKEPKIKNQRAAGYKYRAKGKIFS